MHRRSLWRKPADSVRRCPNSKTASWGHTSTDNPPHGRSCTRWRGKGPKFGSGGSLSLRLSSERFATSDLASSSHYRQLVWIALRNLATTMGARATKSSAISADTVVPHRAQVNGILDAPIVTFRSSRQRTCLLLQSLSWASLDGHFFLALSRATPPALREPCKRHRRFPPQPAWALHPLGGTRRQSADSLWPLALSPGPCKARSRSKVHSGPRSNRTESVVCGRLRIAPGSCIFGA